MFHDQRPGGDPVPADPAGVVTASRFALTETKVEDGCLEIAVKGELDMAVSDQLHQAIARCQDDRILIDLAACQFIDSTAIAVILRAHSRGDSRVVVHSPSGQVLRVLEVTGLTGDGLVFTDRRQALAAPA